ncbi:Integrase, catalytic core protein [Phytophthora megakarya]|uniref:Integrase, catalytic core protein n=1 Tax=Phytophthora megakarya TaxID=4795 RepID=A0A225W933_9STRA|nr:Integrase, catalytic core protein [Phytophthora megakarya]
MEPDTNVEEVLRLPPSVSTELELAPFRSQPEAFQDRLVFHPEPERSRQARESLFLLENSPDDEQEVLSEGIDGPPSPQRSRFDEDGLIAEAVMAYVDNIVEVSDTLNSYAEAMAASEPAEWRKAIDAELLSHQRNATWEPVTRRTDTRYIGCRWDKNGHVVRCKARLVAKAFKQINGVDYFETYSPVANMNSIRVMLAVCVATDYFMEQLDADTAFVNHGLSDMVYMDVSHGVQNENGMNGFKSCGADQYVYVKRSNIGYVYVCLYVDDMIIAAKTLGEIREVTDAYNNAFKMKELRTAKFILGMEIDHDKNDGTLMIKQTLSLTTLWNGLDN